MMKVADCHNHRGVLPGINFCPGTKAISCYIIIFNLAATTWQNKTRTKKHYPTLIQSSTNIPIQQRRPIPARATQQQSCNNTSDALTDYLMLTLKLILRTRKLHYSLWCGALPNGAVSIWLIPTFSQCLKASQSQPTNTVIL
jgi:hypothetical protein